jgi:type III pantothenate kinase
MFLACDIGNSFIKAGLFESDKLVDIFSFENTNRLGEIISGREISAAGISSVVPLKTEKVLRLFQTASIPFHIITHNSAFNLKINYKTPETLGIDRICSAEGAYFLNHGIKKDEILVSVDMGTATTVNIVIPPGEFLGGVIAPGVTMMGNALHSYTAQLPEVDFEDYDGMFGSSTRSSIASGLINSTLGMIDRIEGYLGRIYPGRNIRMYLTGGNAEKIIPYMEREFTYEKNLVLYGILAVSGSKINI